MNELENITEEIEIFVQGEGITEFVLIKADPRRTFAEVIEINRSSLSEELTGVEELLVLVEADEREVSCDQPLVDIGLKHRDRVHIHRCRKVKVTVNFNHLSETETVPPVATVAKVKRWAVKKFGIDEQDATEHALQICGTSKRPNEDTHVGSLTNKDECSICFDLVPKKRVEGACSV